MRNFIKPAGSPARHRARGLAAVVASVALAAGLGAYPAVQAEETTTVSDITTDDAGLPTYSWMDDDTPSSSATPSAPAAASASNPASASASKPAEAPATANPVTVERKGVVDRIVVNDPDGEAWEFGGKASKENIFALKREGKGEIKEVLSVTADGRKLEPYDYGFVNAKDGSFVAFNLNALHTIPPQVVEIEVRTTDAGEYAIAESADVPAETQLAESGYGKGRPAEEAPDQSVGQNRDVATIPGWPDKELSAKQDFSYRYVNGNPEISFTATGDKPAYRLTRFAVKKQRNDSNTKSVEGPVRIRVTRADQTVVSREVTFRTVGQKENADFANQRFWNKNNLGKSFDTEFRLVPEITDIEFQPGDTVTMNLIGPPNGWYAAQIWGQELEKPTVKPDKLVQFSGHGGVQLTDPSFNAEGPHFEASTTVESRIKFKEAIVKIKAPSSSFDWKYFHFDANLIEPGVKFKLEKLPGNNDGDNVLFKVVPMKDGKVVDSVLVEKGSNFIVSGSYFNNPITIDGMVDIYGEPVKTQTDTGKIEFPADFDRRDLPDPVPNPVLPKKCGLKIAIVADRSASVKFRKDLPYDQAKKRRGPDEDYILPAMSVVEALNGTLTEVGLYEFGTGAREVMPSTSLSTQAGFERAKNAIEGWKYWPDGSPSTNWEAGLKQVKGKGYDLVYFITDGMPTFDDLGWQANKPGGGQYVQKTSLRLAIERANEIKNEGTRIEPLLVNVKMRNGQTVDEELVLRDILRTTQPNLNKYIWWYQETLSDAQKKKLSAYQYPNDDSYPNFKTAIEHGAFKIINDRQSPYDWKKNVKDWALGTLNFQQTAEYISWTGVPKKYDTYTDLAGALKKVVDEQKTYCEGELIVQKQTYDENGKLLDEAAPGWRFNASDAAAQNILKNGYRILNNPDLGNPTGAVRSSSQLTARETVDAPNKTVKGEAAWRIVSNSKTSLKVNEQSQPGFTLMPQDGKNAVCTQTIGFKEPGKDNPGYFESVAEVVNDGENGFIVKAEPYASVRCVVANRKSETGLDLQLEKVDADGVTGSLSGAEFNLSWIEDGQVKNHPLTGGTATYSVEKLMRPGIEYTLTETRAPRANGEQYALLVQPLKFKIESATTGGYQVQYFDGVNYTNSLPAEVTEGKVFAGNSRPVISLKVANVRQGNLPKTGGIGLFAPTVAGFLVIGLGAVMGTRRQRG